MLDKEGFNASIQHGTMKIFLNSTEMAVGDTCGGMYALRMRQSALTVKNFHKQNRIHQWHRQLAHRHPDAIRRLEHENLASGIVTA